MQSMNACRSFAEQPGGFEEMFASSLQLPACVTPDQMMLVAADVDSGLDALSCHMCLCGCRILGLAQLLVLGAVT